MIYVQNGLILLLFSCLFSSHNNRCSIENHDFRVDRPSTEASVFSPTGYFLIHYDLTGIHAPSQEDYIYEVGVAAENARDVLVNQLDFLSEVPDGDGKYDIYIQDRPAGYYGVNYEDTCGNCSGVSQASWIIIDNEYEEGEFLTSGIETMKITVAHEFFHAVQRAYVTSGIGNNLFLWEMSATWIEDLVAPNVNDYIFWVDDFFNNPSQDISNTDGYSIALFAHYLSNVIDENANEDPMQSNIMRKIWEEYQTQDQVGAVTDDAFNAIKLTLENNEYNSSFSYAWGDFCSRSHFNGVYNDINNDIYFSSDQSLIAPLDLNHSALSQDVSTGNIIFGGESAGFKKYLVNSQTIISLVHHLTPNNASFEGFVSIKSNNQSLNEIIPIMTNNDLDPYFLNQDDYIFLTYANSENTIVNVDIDYDYEYEITDGDANLNDVVDITDAVLLISFILDQVSFNQQQMDATDINGDELWNVFDVILLVDIILG